MDTSKISLKDKIAKKLSSVEQPLHIKEIAEDFVWIPESTIRWRLNENVWVLFDRIWKGLYVLKWEKATIGLINWDARNLDNKFESNSIDLIISDHAWLDEKSHTWWTRKFANYDCFKYEQNDFDQKYKVLKDWCFLIEFLPEKNENNRRYLRDIEDMAEKSWKKDVILELMSLENKLNIPSTQYIEEYVLENEINTIEEYKKYLEELKVWNTDFNIKKIEDFISSKEFKELEKKYNNAWFKYFAEVNISWWNSNIWRKKKYISTAYFFTKWESRKLKIWDEKLAKEIKEWKFEFMKDEYRIDFKKVYSEVLNIEKDIKVPDEYKNEIVNIFGEYPHKSFLYNEFKKTLNEEETIEELELTHDNFLSSWWDYDSIEKTDRFKNFESNAIDKLVKFLYQNWYTKDDIIDSLSEIKDWSEFKKYDYSLLQNILNDFKDRITNNFDFRITKKEAEYILKNIWEFENFSFDIMCKEFGENSTIWEDDEDNKIYWTWLHNDDLNEDNKLDSEYKTFDIVLNIKSQKEEFINKLNTLNLNKEDSFDNEKLRERFLYHVNKNELPQFKKYNKILEKLQDLYHYKKNWVMNENQEKEYWELQIQENAFYNAFSEYIEFLKKEDSYKMWTKTILPEFFIWDNESNKRHESQKPLNTFEEIILQTSNEWEIVLEQFAWSYVWVEAIIKIWEDWKWWRDYFWIELDKEIFEKNVQLLKEKYKNFKFYTYSDFYSEISENIIDDINSWNVSKTFQIIKSSIDKINDDLNDIITIDLIDFKVNNEDEKIIASNMLLNDNDVVLKFNNKRSRSDENKVLSLVVNKNENTFDVVNQKWVKVNKVYDLQEWLIKMYNTFR